MPNENVFFGHRFDICNAIRLSCTVFRKADREQTFNPDVYWAPIAHYCRLLINVVPQRYRARICCSDLMIFEGCDNWLDHQGAIADIANRVRATDPGEKQEGTSMSSIISPPLYNNCLVCLRRFITTEVYHGTNGGTWSFKESIQPFWTL